ncbi:MAG TPA: protein-glutamate O-methyltransferase CheR [Syntrophobacteraceae bacterium]|nr:protein-glutamate O-methyltransferase CheR [Syntrophobacteraceae bacterium]
MRFYYETLSLSDSEFTILRDLVHERIGLFYDNGKREQLADKLSPLVLESGLSSFLDFYYLLRYDDVNAGPQWERVADALSVQETYFWREMDQVRALVDVLAPAHFASNTCRPLRIWSAGCATGEEPLTIAMALDEAGWLRRGNIEIHASDMSPAAIEKARKGLYRERSFRNLPPRLKTRYFVSHEGCWQVDPELHSRIRWSVINLRAHREAVSRIPEMSVIFCRNVFIYFSEAGVRSTVRLFYDRLQTPGYLCVGAAESLLKATGDLELEEIGGAFVYVKR